MRSNPIAVLCLLAACLAPGAAAQSLMGCTQDDPCPLFVVVDDSGFPDDQLDYVSDYFTKGDWYAINVTNDDLVAHTVTLQGHAVSLAVGPESDGERTFLFDRLGCFDLRDAPTGDVIRLRVVAEDSNDIEQGVVTVADPCAVANDRRAVPDVGIPLLVATLVACVLVGRRRLA